MQERNAATMSKEKPEGEGTSVDCEVFNDSIGAAHFLPPKRCRTCDD